MDYVWSVTQREWGGSCETGEIGVLLVGEWYGFLVRGLRDPGFGSVNHISHSSIHTFIHRIPEPIPPQDTATQYSDYPSCRALPRHNHGTTLPYLPNHIPIPTNHLHRLPPPPDDQTKRSASQSPPHRTKELVSQPYTARAALLSHCRCAAGPLGRGSLIEDV